MHIHAELPAGYGVVNPAPFLSPRPWRRSTLEARQAEATGAGAAVDEAAGREKSAAAALDTAAGQIAALQTQQEQLRADESEGQLQTEARPGARDLQLTRERGRVTKC